MLRNLAFFLAVFTLLGSATEPPDQSKQALSRRVERDDDGWSEKTLKNLSLEEKVGQLFMIRMRVELLNGKSPSYFELPNNIRKYHIGSLAMSAPTQSRARDTRRCREGGTPLTQLQEASELTLLVAGQFEEG